MKYFLFVFFLNICCFYSPLAQAQFQPKDSRWKLVLIDEFDTVFAKTVVNDKLWDRLFPWGQDDTPIICNGDTTKEITYISRTGNSNLRVDTTGNGTLSIIARKVKHRGQFTRYYDCDSIQCAGKQCKKADNGNMYCVVSAIAVFDYTTAMLYSKYKFRYGYFEMRYQLPDIPDTPATNIGISTDWWMFNGNPWATRPTPLSEIDIFEIRNADNLYSNNVHYQKDSTSVDYSLADYCTIDSTWHISALEWGPDRIDFYLDGEKIRSYPNHPDKLIAMPMIIDMDVLPSNWCVAPDSTTLFPITFKIDYVKVYQFKPDRRSTKRSSFFEH